MKAGKYFIEENLELNLEEYLEAVDSCGALDLIDHDEKTINELATDYGYASAYHMLENF